jgi:adenine specific DNA methylase Mod
MRVSNENSTAANRLYFGDNLELLRDHIKDTSVDLVYLDPPFNSKANYNVLFKDRGGAPTQSQAGAFCDTWTWGSFAPASSSRRGTSPSRP